MKCVNTKCNKEHDSSYGSGKYCSRKCANSRKWLDADKLKKSVAAKESEKVTNARENKTLSVETIKKFQLAIQLNREKSKVKTLTDDWDTLSWERIRKRVIWEQEGKCIVCGLFEWRGKSITLEIDHKDGNSKNNKRDNVEALCPNCHSLTNTWRGRNKSKRINKISDEELLTILLKHNWNIRQSLIEVKLSPKGGNYKRCHKLKRMTL
jgi:hypothetical protein